MARQRSHIALFVLSIFYTLVVSCLGSAADSSFQTEMLERINSLEKQGRQQAEQMQAMETRLQDQERTISDYKQRVADLEQTVTDLQQKQDPKAEDDQVDSNAGSNKTPGTIRQGRSEHAENRQASKRIRRSLVNAEGPVAFHGLIKATDVDHLGLNQNIVFPDVMLNLGGGYHNQHGVFIAPQPGVYIFSASIMAQDRVNHPELAVHLMKNGQVLANAYAHAETASYDQGSVTVVTQLVVGDEVWVSLKYPSDTSTHGNYYDSFMGCLVYPL